MTQSYRDLMQALSCESADDELPKEQSEKFEVEKDLKQMGQVQIALPWEEAITPEISRLSVMLESRGYEVVGTVARSASFEGQAGDGTMDNSRATMGDDGNDIAHDDIDTDGIANDVKNGIYIKTVVQPPTVTVIRPEDVVPSTVDESEVVYLKAEDQEQAEEIQAYLSTEGIRVAITPEEVCDLLDAQRR